MKKHLLLPMLFAGLWATPACATPYIGVSAGLGLLNKSDVTAGGHTVTDVVEYKAGVPFGVAIGFKSDEYRIEGAVSYQTYSVDNYLGVPATGADAADVSALLFMANGYYDFSIKDSGVSPYLTGGVGLASVKSKSAGVTDPDESVFAWQVGAGLGFKASENVVVDLGYRYFRTSDVTSKDGTMAFSVSGSNILAGIRYNF